MMLGLVWYIGCLAGGFVWLGGSSIAAQLSMGELIAGSLVIGTIAPAYITYLIACCLSMLEHQTLIIANLLMAYLVGCRLTAFAAEMRRRFARGFASERGDALVAAALTGIGSLIFWPLYSTRMIPEENGRIFSGGSCWADLPIHMHIAESFLSGRNQDVSWGDMQSPVFAGEKMYYPFIPDWHAAVMVKIGATMRWGFLLPGFVMCLAFLALFFYFGARLTRSRLGSLLGLALVIGAGGMGGVNILRRDGLSRALEQDVIQNDVTGEGRVFWFAFMPHVFFPQRGANFAYPLALLALLLVWKGTDTSPAAAAAGVTAGDRRRMLMHAAAFAALTPLVQAHSFIGLAIIIGTVFVLDAHKWLADLRVLGAWIAAGVIAALVGVPQMALFRKHVASGHGGSFIKQGWIHKNNPFGSAEGVFAAIPMAGGFFRFWWMSLGPAVPLFLAALVIYGYDALQGARLGAAPVVAIPGTPAAAAGGAPASGKSSAAAVAASEAAGRASGVAGGADAGMRRRVGGGSDSDEGEVSPAGAAAAPKARDFRSAGSSASSSAQHMSVFGPADGTTSADASLAEHLIAVTLAQLPAPIAGRLTGAIPVRYRALDNFASGGNANSITGRSLDALKFGIGALAIFLFGNYVNLQPWDRDNCKLFYVWLFVASVLTGSVLASPIEYAASGILRSAFAGSTGALRILQAAFVPQARILAAGAVAERVSAKSGKEKDEGAAAAAAGGPAAAAAAAGIGAAQTGLARTVSLAGLLAVPALLFLATCSGFLLLAREKTLYHQLLDEEQIQMGMYIKEHLAPKSVIAHRDIHIMPSGCIAGRPSLVAYTGWMWSHGYNYYDRDRDRKYMVDNALKDSDPEAYNAMRRWGVRYILGEHMPTHHRPRQQQYEEAMARKAAAPNDTSIVVPAFDPDLYLDGNLRRVFRVGRMDLLEVLGYGFPPG